MPGDVVNGFRALKIQLIGIEEERSDLTGLLFAGAKHAAVRQIVRFPVPGDDATDISLVVTDAESDFGIHRGQNNPVVGSIVPRATAARLIPGNQTGIDICQHSHHQEQVASVDNILFKCDVGLFKIIPSQIGLGQPVKRRMLVFFGVVGVFDGSDSIVYVCQKDERTIILRNGGNLDNAPGLLIGIRIRTLQIVHIPTLIGLLQQAIPPGEVGILMFVSEIASVYLVSVFIEDEDV